MVDSTDAKNYLVQRIKSYVDVSESLKGQILERTTVRKIANDRNLSLYEDDHFFVAEGILKKENQDNQDIAHFIVEGQFGIFPSECSRYSFIGMENCKIVVMRQENLDYLLAQNQSLLPAYRRFLFEWAMQRIWRTELLLLPAAEAKAALLKRLGKFANRISNKDLAAYLSVNTSYYSTI